CLRLGGGNSRDHSIRVLADTIAGNSNVTELQKKPGCPGCNAIHQPISIISAKNTITQSFVPWTDGDLENIIVRTSDQVVTGYRCTNCDPQGEEGFHKIFGRALDYDDSLATCDRCGDKSVLVEIKDSFSVSELLTRFAGFRIPSKFLLADIGEESYL